MHEATFDDAIILYHDDCCLGLASRGHYSVGAMVCVLVMVQLTYWGFWDRQFTDSDPVHLAEANLDLRRDVSDVVLACRLLHAWSISGRAAGINLVSDSDLLYAV